MIVIYAITLVVLGFVIAIWFTNLFTGFDPLGFTVRLKVKNRYGWFLIATFAILGCVPLVVEFDNSDYGGVVAFNDDGTVRDTGHIVWCWMDHCPPIPRSQTIAIKAHPITDNPKVRYLQYTGTARIVRLERFFKRIGTKIDYIIPNESALVSRVMSELYEFNEHHSRELARFYNPLDPRQVEALRNLVEQETALALDRDGIEFTVTSFSLD